MTIILAEMAITIPAEIMETTPAVVQTAVGAVLEHHPAKMQT